MGSEPARRPRRLWLLLIGMAAAMSACVAEPAAPSPYYNWYTAPYYYPYYPDYYYWGLGWGHYRTWHEGGRGHEHHGGEGGHGGHHH